MKASFIRNKVVYLLGMVLAVAIIVLFYTTRDIKSVPKEKMIMGRIAEQQEIIKKYCHQFNVSPRMYVSILFSELYNNLNFYDEFDEVRANIGFDPSIGFSQIRVSTAFWIENNYTVRDIITKSRTKKELIAKLVDDNVNIAYSVFYVSLISKAVEQKTKRANINTVASYYGRGIDFNKEVSDTLYSNFIGKTAEQFFNSENLRVAFPD